MNLCPEEESVSISLWPEITYLAKLIKCCVFISDTHQFLVTERARTTSPFCDAGDTCLFLTSSIFQSQERERCSELGYIYLHIHVHVLTCLPHSAFFSLNSLRKVSRKLEVLKTVWWYCCFYLVQTSIPLMDTQLHFNYNHQNNKQL